MILSGFPFLLSHLDVMLIAISTLVAASLLLIRLGRKKEEAAKEEKKSWYQPPANAQPFIGTVQKPRVYRTKTYSVSRKARRRIVKKLRVMIYEKHIYRNRGITLEQMAQMQGTNRTYLSQVIREEYGENFASFINLLRIDEAIRILHDKTNQTPIKVIAESLGYKSISTFYSCFNKHVKCSPSQYRRLSHSGELTEMKQFLMKEEV